MKKYMRAELQNSTLHVIYGLLFVLLAIGAIVAIVIINSRTDTSSQSATVSNATPTIDSVTISDLPGGAALSATEGLGFSPTANSSSMVLWLTGTASDSNGCTDIDTKNKWRIVVFRSNATNTTNCTDDNGQACQVAATSSINLTGCSGNDNNLTFDQSLTVPYYIDSTATGSSPNLASRHWKAYVRVLDDNAGASGDKSSTFEVETLKAISISPTSLSYGTISVGGAASNDLTTTITNTGNYNVLNPNLSQTDWTCTTGGSALTAGNTKFSTAGGTGYASKTALTTSNAASGLSIPKGASGNTGAVYTELQVPSATYVGGSCSSTLTIVAPA